MNRDDDPKLTLDDNEWRIYKRATRNLKYRQRMAQDRNCPNKVIHIAWLQAVEWDDAGDPVLAKCDNLSHLPVELVA